jgi:uncharacterized membrane protein
MKTTNLPLRNSTSLLWTAAMVGAVLMLVGTPTAARAFTFITLDFPGATATEASGINPEGQIVGDYTDASGVVHGFVLNRGTFTTIDVPGATDTVVDGINPEGQIVGNFTDAMGILHGFAAGP